MEHLGCSNTSDQCLRHGGRWKFVGGMGTEASPFWESSWCSWKLPSLAMQWCFSDAKLKSFNGMSMSAKLSQMSMAK